MSSKIQNKYEKNSIFSQDGLEKLLNANTAYAKGLIRTFNSSESLEFTNFKDMHEFKIYVEKWNKFIPDIISKYNQNEKILQNDSQLDQSIFTSLFTNQDVQKVILKEIFSNEELLAKIKKSL